MVKLVNYTVAVALVLGTVSANMGCEVVDVVPEFLNQNNLLGVCSGAGQCERATCVCNEGYTGLSDILNSDGEDCQINILAVRCLWAFNLVWTFLLIGRSLPRIRLKYSQFLITKKLKEDIGLPTSIFHNRGMMSVIFVFGVCLPAVIAYSIMSLINPDLKIGLNFLPTFLHAIARTGFYMGVCFFQPLLFTTLFRSKSYKKLARRLILINEWGTFFVCVGSSVLGFVPFITLYGTDDAKGFLAITVWYLLMFGTVLMLTCLGIQAGYLWYKVEKVLTRSHDVSKSDRILQIKGALVDTQRESLRQAVLQGIIYMTFCLWGFLFNKYTYYLPIGWLAYPLIAKKIAFTTINTSSSKDRSTGSNGEKSKSKKTNDSSTFQSSFRTNNIAVSSFVEKAQSFHEPRPDENEDESV